MSPEYRYTPLMIATHEGHVEIVNLLIAQGVDVSLRANNRVTALQVAKIAGHDDLVEILKKRLLGNI